MSTFHSTPSAASSTSAGLAATHSHPRAAGRARPAAADGRADSRGSVLVFVVGILLLLAIIATAFLGTSRTDRTATQQNAFNTQIDLLLDGVINATKAKLIADGRWNTDSNGIDSPLTDTFLASRIPTLLHLGVPGSYNQATALAAPPRVNTTLNPAAPASNLPAWAHISSPLFGSMFSYPMERKTGMPATFDARQSVIPTSTSINGRTYPAFAISSAIDSIMSSGNPTFPAADYADSGSYVAVVPAMDADGDGIADAGMVQLPVGQIAGVTYYCGIRVVDMNSALNANVATHWNDTPQTAPTMTNPSGSAFAGQAIIGNFFPTNIDLYNALTGAANADRDTQLYTQKTGLYALRYGEAGVAATPSSAIYPPLNDNIATRGDYRFTNLSEMLWMQLGRRLTNPGYHLDGSGSVAYQLAQLDINNAIALASKFIIRESGSSSLEKALQLSLVDQAPAKAYNADQALGWFNSNFAFTRAASGAAQAMPIRSILTSFNPTGADQAKPVVNEVTGTPATHYFGDVRTFFGRKFVCIAPYTTILPTDPTAGLGMRDWVMLGSVNGTEKTNLNTADFGELYWSFRRYLSTREENLQQPAPVFAASSPFPMVGVTATGLSMYEQMKWRQYRNVIRDPIAQDPIVTADAKTNLPNAVATAASPDLAPRFMTSSEVMQMRAALAAVNTIDMRDDDDNITARRIQTAVYPNDPTAGASIVARHDVTVFGTERQPYITEVYVNNDTVNDPAGTGPNQRGYVAIEIYNPYPDPINLNGWSLGVINRRRGANGAPIANPAKNPGQPLTIEPILSQPGTGFNQGRFGAAGAGDPWNDIVIPARGYLVLENYQDAGGNLVPDPTPTDNTVDATYRPTGMGAFTATTAGIRVKFVHGLSRVLWDGLAAAPGLPNGGELVLLRPRVANLRTGVFTPTVQPNDPIDPCDEGTSLAPPNLYDLVPVDSFDFTNMNAVPGNPNFNVWHYVRANTGATLPPGPEFWKWVKGGPYVVTASPSTVAQVPARQGSAVAAFTPPAVEPALSTTNFGGPDGAELPFDPTAKQGVQINAEGWPGPRQKDAATTTFNLFPAGAFSRETDVFKIPTIGAYKILTRAVAAPTITPDGMTLPATVEDISNAAELGNFTEMNSLAMDHSFADNEDPVDLAAATTGTAPMLVAGNPAPLPIGPSADDAYEQVGRLCPTSTLNPAAYVNYPNTWAAPSGYVTPDDTNGEAPAGNTTRSPVDFYDPNFDFTTGLISTKTPRSIFDYFTVMGHSNVLPNVGMDEYVTTYMGANVPPAAPQFPAYLPTSSSPKAAGRAPNITYMVAGTGTNTNSLRRGANVPPAGTGGNDIDYSGCLVQVVSGPRRGLLGRIDNTPPTSDGKGDAMPLIGAGIAGLQVGDIVRVVSTTEETPTDSGLININTAPWYVLARLPLVHQAAGSPAVDAEATSDLAKRIVQYRDGNPLGNTPYERRGHGPFKSILDLNRVMDAAGTQPIFQEAVNASSTATVIPNGRSTNISEGDISPAFTFTYDGTGKRNNAGTPVATGPESVAGDFENRYLTLSRIANMVTTRSDAFVVYVQLQGWRGAGTAGAEMVTQRRAAFIIDRSTASETVSSSLFRVPAK